MQARLQAFAGRLPAGGRGCAQLLRLAVLGFAVSGCAINPRVELAELHPDPQPLVLKSVPFYPQTEHQCGPAALAGVLVNSGVDTSPEALSPQVFLPEREGSLQIELLAATRRAGRIPYVVDSEVEALVAELEAGRPVLVFQNLGTPGIPRWHYAVLVGADPEANRVYLNSGKKQLTDIRAGTFARTWDWADRWAMVALRPGELPASPDALHYYRAVAAFETVGDAAASRQAWLAAAREWPHDYRPHLALGNLAFAAGDHASAIGHFEKGLELDPDSAVLENNLAEAIAAAGCPGAAHARLAAYVDRLEEGSAWRADLETTLRDIQQGMTEDRSGCAAMPAGDDTS